MYVFDIRNLRIDKSGNYILVGEQNKTYTTYSQNHTTIKEYYLDIFILKIDPDGKLVWEVRIPKKQVFVPTANKKAGNMYDFASYALVMTDDKLLFFINDNIENLVIENRPKQVKWDKSCSQVIIIDKDGEMQRKIISDIPGKMMNNSFFELLPDNRVLTRYSFYKKYDKGDYRILDLRQFLAQ
jgi:hypothetical protein